MRGDAGPTRVAAVAARRTATAVAVSVRVVIGRSPLVDRFGPRKTSYVIQVDRRGSIIEFLECPGWAA
jgi:hypothetical protein